MKKDVIPCYGYVLMLFIVSSIVIAFFIHGNDTLNKNLAACQAFYGNLTSYDPIGGCLVSNNCQTVERNGYYQTENNCTKWSFKPIPKKIGD